MVAVLDVMAFLNCHLQLGSEETNLEEKLELQLHMNVSFFAVDLDSFEASQMLTSPIVNFFVNEIYV